MTTLGQLRMPGAQYIAQRTNRNMAGGPPKATHHITWDVIRDDGSRIITLAGVSNYLLNVGYEPHVVIDPFTGEAFQLLDALSSGFALENNGIQTNRAGDVNLQVEWFFTPGTLWQGRRYQRLTDTPMLGLPEFLSWCDGWGIPRIAPLRPGDRNQYTWRDVAGHYGHFNAPLNSHSDPIVDIADILNSDTPPTPTPEGITNMEFTYVVDQGKGGEDWVWLGPERIHARCGSVDALVGLQTAGMVKLGTRSREFHDWLFGVSSNARFTR